MLLPLALGIIIVLGIPGILLEGSAAQSNPEILQRLQILELKQQQFQVTLNTVWVFFTGTLVFFMNAGFAMLESGFCRRKNSITVLAKNLIVFCLATFSFWILGFGLMFGDGTPWFGTSGFFLVSPSENSPTTGANYRGVFTALNWAALPLTAKFFFQLTFAGTAATIISGAIAERVKFTAFLLFSPLFVGIAYAIVGHWVWGGGWLAELGFWDFAGSTVVHSVGGWAGLMGTLILGPRIGKYSSISESDYQQLSFKTRSFRSWGSGGSRSGITPAKRIHALPAENLSLATLGCLILWVGWFGFNAGSTLEANTAAIVHILLNTLMAGSLGGIGATIGGWIYLSKPSLSFIINGILAGCVSITAACAYVDVGSAAIIGLCGGLIVIFSTILLDKALIDDPVGAIPVHLCCGIWGTLCVGLFSDGPTLYPRYGILEGPALGLLKGGGLEVLGFQFLGIIAIAAFTIVFSLLTWGLIRLMLNHSLRVSRTQELLGLDDAFDDKADEFHNKASAG
ncbi:ammonium transporter [Lyngbya confervoides]|uniref:Ammonium transporter n=1 Tax=Lyngbya confervoides BDU141951 TaxID=1574623 RepID=A0ABD4T5P4_9CYAN|nr:ammonium transporter [Lyngbya confervoides]MCM1984032.1 ammonium transporter [Lyngbya confervoides BDU141951]